MFACSSVSSGGAWVLLLPRALVAVEVLGAAVLPAVVASDRVLLSVVVAIGVSVVVVSWFLVFPESLLRVLVDLFRLAVGLCNKPLFRLFNFSTSRFGRLQEFTKSVSARRSMRLRGVLSIDDGAAALAILTGAMSPYLLLAHIKVAHSGMIVRLLDKVSRLILMSILSLQFRPHKCRYAVRLVPGHWLVWATLNLGNSLTAPLFF